MQNADVQNMIEKAISIVAEISPQQTRGNWLEELTALVGPYIREWDISCAYMWGEWPERETRFRKTTKQDVGIDVVAVRRSDGEHIAIQCKSRELNEKGQGDTIPKRQIDTFVSTSAAEFWAERWIVTNGDNPLSGNSQQAFSMHQKPIKVVNIASDLQQQQATFTDEDCPHCAQNPDGECEVRRLWDEAVAEAMGWDAEHLARLRYLLHQEPHVRGLGYNQYGDGGDETDTFAETAMVEERE